MAAPDVVAGLGAVQRQALSGYFPPIARSRMIEKPWSTAAVAGQGPHGGPYAPGWPVLEIADPAGGHRGTRVAGHVVEPHRRLPHR